jgi:hypothetical protein
VRAQRIARWFSYTTPADVAFLVERAGAGTSVEDLAAELRTRVTKRPDLALRIDEVVAGTLGEGWQRSSQERFDREFAESSVRFYDANAIPRVATPPAEVSDVHFAVDLGSIPTVEPAGYRGGDDLFSALARR